jgi:hypothetical protein
MIAAKVSRLAHVVVFAFVTAACGGGSDAGPTNPGSSVPASMLPAAALSTTGTVGTEVSERPAVVVRNQRSETMTGVTVTFEVTAGDGVVTGATATTDASGVARVGSWTLGPVAGTSNNTLTARSGTLVAISFTATATPGPVHSAEKITGTDGLSAHVGTSVVLPPAVVVRDEHGNPVDSVAVTFAVVSGGGTIGAESAITGIDGVAGAGSWTMGPEPGENAVTATVAGLASGPLTFTATARPPSPVHVDAVSPEVLTPGVTAVLTGRAFSAIATENEVTIAGVEVVVVAATATELTVAVPNTMPCVPTGPVEVKVQVGPDFGTAQHPLRTATARTLAVGEMAVYGAAGSQCNELIGDGGRYLMTVHNVSTICDFSTICTPTSFEFRGAAPSGASVSPQLVRGASVAPGGLASMDAMPDPLVRDEGAHLRLLEENIRFLNQNRALLRRSAAARTVLPAADPQVGDEVPVKIPKVQASGFCTNFEPITARVAYVGVRSMILEDKANQLQGQIDTLWQKIGSEFDNAMWPIVLQNFGNPLVWDQQAGNVGRVVMVFSRYINDNIPGIAGFVVSCDLFPPGPTSSSNYGPYFYAYTPTDAGTAIPLEGQPNNTPPRWRWAMRPTVIHEVKHIASFAARIANGASSFEESWLEESSARISEELYERQRYGFLQSGNTGYGSEFMPVGPWCGVRLSTCATNNDQPRGFVRAFEDLYLGWYSNPQARSPLGRFDSGDFSFYATGWSLLRWAIDHSPTAESAFLTALNQSTQRGLENLGDRAGRTFEEMLPEWLLSMALDDRASVAVNNPSVNFPSWNIRNIFQGLNTDFSNQGFYLNPFPFSFWSVNYGAFVFQSSALQGTGAFLELAGIQSGPQMVEIRSLGGGPPASNLRLAIIRLQ